MLEGKQISDLQSVFKDFNSEKKKAFMGDCLQRGCSNSPIGSHLISKCILSRIARDGHVSSFAYPSTGDIIASAPDLPEQKSEHLGYNKASAFKGFCKTHDSKIFAPIDSLKIEVSRRTLSLLAYRIYADSILTKYHVAGFFFKKFGEAELPDEMMAIGFRDFQHMITLLGNFDLVREDCESQDSSYLSHYVVELQKSPPFATSGLFIPYVDARCRELKLQDSWIAMSVLPQEDSGLAIMSWPTKNSASCERLVKSVKGIPDLAMGDWLLKYALEHMERIYFDPQWLDSIPPDKRTDLNERFFRSINPRKKPDACVLPKALFDVPGKGIVQRSAIARYKI